MDTHELAQKASSLIVAAFCERVEQENAKVLAERPEVAADGETPRVAQQAVRNLILLKLDNLWQQHLLAMDHLRSDVMVRSFGQRDPLMEFKHEGFKLFDDLSHNLRREIAQDLFKFRVITMRQHHHLQELLAQLQMERSRSFAEEMEAQVEPAPSEAPPEMPKAEPVVSDAPRIGRNAPCPCGSGKKYKACCGAVSADSVID
jgi:preprotein translocase subunit SecA